ncbi:MAG: YraN family protein [Bacteroidetes bacterium]|nr:YraN family protein [Bacteroidota bacterium]MCL2302651.1 YraN family protein [Lentimicrobiaceae bacterium]
MTEKQQFGRRGEELALAFYTGNKYTILEKNWQSNHLEVDIIAKNDEYIVFCEVKTRSGNAFGEPQQSVTKQKQQNIIRAANYYVLKHQIKLEVRFDIIAIIFNGEGYNLEHIPFAFTPKW